MPGLEPVGLLVQRQQFLAAPGQMHAQVPLHLVGVEHVQRPIPVVGEIVGDIHKRRNRAQADGLQLGLQPGRAWPILHAADHAACEHGRMLQRIVVDGHANGARESARHGLDRRLDQRAQPPGGQIARDPVHAQRIAPVGRDRDFDHGIDPGGVIFGQPVGEAFAHLARGQLDDAVVLVRQFHLAFRTHHPVAFDAANLAHLDGRVDAGHVGAGVRDHDCYAVPRIRRPADDLLFALIGRDLADAQPVGIGVLFGLDHLAQCEPLERVEGVYDLFDLQPQVGQGLGNLIHRSLGGQVLFQPGQGEFHGPTRVQVAGLYHGGQRAKGASDGGGLWQHCVRFWRHPAQIRQSGSLCMRIGTKAVIHRAGLRGRNAGMRPWKSQDWVRSP